MGENSGNHLKAQSHTEARFFWFWNFVLLSTGVAQCLIAYEFVLIGFAANSHNLITAVGNPLGQTLLSAMQPELWRELYQTPKSHAKWALCIAIAEMAGNVTTQISIALIGSGLHQIVYSFIVVCNALLGRLLFHKHLSAVRWVALLIITLSVACASFGQNHVPGRTGLEAHIGLASAVVATLSFSSAYIMLNRFFDTNAPSQQMKGTRPQQPLVLALLLGLVEVSVMGTYFLICVVPRWQELVVVPMGDVHPTAWRCILHYLVYLIVCGLHQYSFYFCMSFGELAAVTSGVNKSAQAATLFFGSSALFCNVVPQQCINIRKVIATIGVCTGVLIYGAEDLLGFARAKQVLAMNTTELEPVMLGFARAKQVLAMNTTELEPVIRAVVD